MKLLVVDLFGTLIPMESDALAHRMLAERVCRVDGCDPREFEVLYDAWVGKVGDSSAAVYEAYRDVPSDRKEFTRFELEYLHMWCHIEAAEVVGEVPGARCFLSKAKGMGFVTAVVSDAAPGVPRGVLRVLDLDNLVNEVIASGETLFRKPSPNLVRAIIERLGFRPSLVVVVGDSPRDRALAANCGAIFIGLGIEGDYSARNLFEASRALESVVADR